MVGTADTAAGAADRATVIGAASATPRREDSPLFARPSLIKRANTISAHEARKILSSNAKFQEWANSSVGNTQASGAPERMLEAWARREGFSNYLPALAAQGYDTLRTLQVMTPDAAEDLIRFASIQPGHAGVLRAMARANGASPSIQARGSCTRQSFSSEPASEMDVNSPPERERQGEWHRGAASAWRGWTCMPTGETLSHKGPLAQVNDGKKKKREKRRSFLDA